MGQSIAVMNTKGGVGKSTIVMALAETLSAIYRKNILVVDSDSQTSMSIMLMDMDRWEHTERKRQNLVEYLSRAVLHGEQTDWRPHVAACVSDVEDADSVYLIPSHMNLSLFEREVASGQQMGELRQVIRQFLADARNYFDYILIDCPPGLSVLTECWLREADFFLPPTRPDYLSVRGLSILKRFRELSLEFGFAELAGVVINQKDSRIRSEQEWHDKLMADPANRCFSTAIPRRAYIQRAADYDPGKRTYLAKYPGDAGQSVKLVTQELMQRLADAAAAMARRPENQAIAPAPQPTPAQPAPVQPAASVQPASVPPTPVQPTPAQQIAPAPSRPAVAVTAPDAPSPPANTNEPTAKARPSS